MPNVSNTMPRSGILIVGGGIIGLSLALELRARGADVCVVERDKVLRQTSWAAAGMLAVQDPHNPAILREISTWSASLYEGYLDRVRELSGLPVEIQTTSTVQYAGDGSFVELAEWSLDPRQLGAALNLAVRAAGVELREEVASWEDEGKTVVHASGAWFAVQPWVRPRKGQMLRVQIPAHVRLEQVHRAQEVYVVPRTRGAQQGTALIGATVEDVGFDLTTHVGDLRMLRKRAARMLPWIASESGAPETEAWAGLRPATVDELPVLGRLPGTENEFVAGGHFRNGILLAPATAVAMADLMEGKPAVVEMEAFSPERFARS